MALPRWNDSPVPHTSAATGDEPRIDQPADDSRIRGSMLERDQAPNTWMSERDPIKFAQVEISV